MSQDCDSAVQRRTIHRVTALNRGKGHGNYLGISVVHVFEFLKQEDILTQITATYYNM